MCTHVLRHLLLVLYDTVLYTKTINTMIPVSIDHSTNLGHIQANTDLV